MLGLKVEGRVASLDEILDPGSEFDGNGVPIGTAGKASDAPVAGGLSAGQLAQVEQTMRKVMKEELKEGMQSVMTEHLMPQFKEMFEGAFSKIVSVAGYKSSSKGKGRAEPEPRPESGSESESETQEMDEDQPVSEFSELKCSLLTKTL